MTDTSRTRVLVADADEGIRSLVRLTLDGDSYDVAEAVEAEQAILAIASSRPQLVLLDAALPGAGGVPLARSLKAQPETRDAVIVLMFAKEAGVDETRAAEAGVDEFLAKPFNAFTLLKKVDALVGETG